MADPARARKVAERIKVTVAETLEKRIKDERLGFVTVTDVRVTGDLQHASIFYTVFGDEAARTLTAEALATHRGRIRSAVGKALGIRLTPSIEFIPDALPEGAAHLEGLLAEAKVRDELLAAAAQGKTYAGDADPYRKPHEDDDEEETSDGDDSDDTDDAGDDSDDSDDDDSDD